MNKPLTIFLFITLNFLYATSISKSIAEYEKGLSFYNEKNYTKARIFFSNALNINSNVSYPYLMIGNCFYYQKFYTNAIKQYEKYLDRPYTKNNIGYTYLYISKCYRKLSNFNLALTNLKRAERLIRLFHDKTDYYFEALNYFNDKEKNNKKINDKNFFEKIFYESYQYSNSYYIQNNLGRFYLYKSENIKKTNSTSMQIITNLDIATSYFKKAIILNKTNNSIYFKNYYHCFGRKGEFYKLMFETILEKEAKDNKYDYSQTNNYPDTLFYYKKSIKNYNEAINLIQKNNISVYKEDLTVYKIYKNELEEHYQKYFKK